jgi:hypothetical protein
VHIRKLWLKVFKETNKNVLIAVACEELIGTITISLLKSNLPFLRRCALFFVRIHHLLVSNMQGFEKTEFNCPDCGGGL